MKISCPDCNAVYDVEDQLSGQTVECSSCGTKFVVQKSGQTKKCPFCAETISSDAIKCKHCGEFLNGRNPSPASSAPAEQPQRFQVANTYYPGWAKCCIVVGLILFLSGWLLFAGNPSAGIAVSVFGFVLFAVGMVSKRLKCDYCGYNGNPKVSGGPNGCAFILLLCLGILPGLIYWFAVSSKYSCPKCGTEVK